MLPLFDAPVSLVPALFSHLALLSVLALSVACGIYGAVCLLTIRHAALL
jgi:hypothetical protein